MQTLAFHSNLENAICNQLFCIRDIPKAGKIVNINDHGTMVSLNNVQTIEIQIINLTNRES